MPDRTIMIKGPFTEEETRNIVMVLTQWLQVIESSRPEETFQILLDDPHTDVAIADLLARIPPRPGYERITREIVP